MKNAYDKFKDKPYPTSKKFILFGINALFSFAFMLIFAISRVWWAFIVTAMIFIFCIIKLIPFITFWDDANNEFIENQRLKKEIKQERLKRPLCTSLQNLIIAEFTRQLCEHLNEEDKWGYSKADVFGEILNGKVHLEINGKNAVAVLNKLEWQKLIYLPSKLPQKDVKKKETEDYSLFAYEWVDTHLTDINAICQEAENNGSFEAYLTDILPERKYWEAIMKALNSRGFVQTEIAKIEGEELIKILR